MSGPRSAEGGSLAPPPARLLVYRPGAIGDLVLALPALEALRAAHPQAHLTVAGHPGAVVLARAAGLADTVLDADSAVLTPLFAPTPPIPAPLPVPDVAVLWAGPAAQPLAASLRALGTREVLRVPAQPAAECRQHVADYLARSLEAIGVAARLPAVPRLPLDRALVADVAAFLATEGGPGGAWLAVHAGSGSPRKNWASAQFAAVARVLAARGLRPLLVAGPAEAELVEGMLDGLAPLRPPVAREWPLPRLAALLSLCAGYVGADSGITHLAAAVGIPVVAVFGPTDPARWAPRGPRVVVVRRPVACQPCTWEAMWACPHRACLTALGPTAVVTAVTRALGL